MTVEPQIDEGRSIDVEVISGANPWNHLDVQNDPDHFSFAVVSDLTGGYREGVFPEAVKRLNWLRPQFVMSVGDLIDGYIEDPASIAAEWDVFDAMLAPLHAPFFYVAGNHDYSNEAMAEVWRKRLGRSYYHFVYRDVLFLVLNTEETPYVLPEEIKQAMAEIDQIEAVDPSRAAQLGRGIRDWMSDSFDPDGTMRGQISDAQVAYFERAIAQNSGVRWVFLFMHQPVWQGDGNPGLDAVAAALKNLPYTVFAGHVHNYRRFEIDGRVHIRLGTTGGGWSTLPGREGNYDHLVYVTMTDEGPSIANLLLDGILDEYGRIDPDSSSWRESPSGADRQED